MASIKAKVKSRVLKWARHTSGLTIEEAAKKAQVKPVQLQNWEAGSDRPTMRQLRLLANAYKYPISTFYLPKPPRDVSIPHDFRRLPSDEALQYSSAIRLELRRANRRRDIAIDLLDELGEAPRPFTAKAKIDQDPEVVGEAVRKTLEIELKQQKKWRDPYRSYRAWRERVEANGVLVFQFSGISTKEIRGFSITNNILPVVAVNVRDKPNGRKFTMLHEFAHLMLGMTGLCDLDEDALRQPAEQKVEVFCNRVAAAALVPRDNLLDEPAVVARGSEATDWDNNTIRALATDYGVSEEVVLRRLLTLGRTTTRFYQSKRREFVRIYKEIEDREREKTKDGFRRNLPQEAISNLGRPFARLVLNNYYQDRITLSDVSAYLGIRARQVSRIEELVGT